MYAFDNVNAEKGINAILHFHTRPARRAGKKILCLFPLCKGNEPVAETGGGS